MTRSPLRSPSSRPGIFTDDRGGRLQSPFPETQVGRDGPPTNDRVTSALALADGPHCIEAALVFRDDNLEYLADPQGNLIGERNATWVDRLLPATTTPDTRRL